MPRHHARLALALSATLACTSSFAASFLPLGDLPGGSFNSQAHGVSADGSVVVGYGNSAGGGQAFRWTLNGGMVGLADSYLAYGVSADGSVVVGHGSSADDGNGQAFRWTSEGGVVGLGPVTPGGFYSDARGVSADGSVVVGAGYNSSFNLQAFRWTAGDGMTSLGGNTSAALGVSADGSIIVGSNGGSAFIWTEDTGMVNLGALPGGTGSGVANAVSADGRVVVGNSNSAIGLQAFRWTEADGTLGLGVTVLPGLSTTSGALGVSADGSIIVGSGLDETGFEEAFIWTEDAGLEQLYDVLIAGGATGLDGWSLVRATAISEDGQWVVGYGLNPLGQNEAFLANIAPVPVPAAVWLFGSALGVLGWLRRRHAPVTVG